MKDGAIILARSILDSEVFASEKLLKIWIWLLCKANFEDRAAQIRVGAGQSTVKVKRGQMIFGRFSAEEELYIDGSTIYKNIKKLEAMGNIQIFSNSHYSLITICNYDYYQHLTNYKVATKKQPRNNQVTAEEHTIRNKEFKKGDSAQAHTAPSFFKSAGWDDHPDKRDYLTKFFPKLFRLKSPLTYPQHQKLIEKYTQERVLKIYGAMENYKPLLSKNESAYLTANKWLDKDQ
jgi:hypothetical protein